MNTFLLIFTLFVYYLEVRKLRKEVKEVKMQISYDKDFWDDDECEEKI